MGIAASQSRLISIQRMQSNYEFLMQTTSQKKSDLAQQASAAGNDPNAAAQLKAEDQDLDTQMQQYQAQQKMCSTEYESVKKMLDDNITRQFKYMS